ncbi:MAG: hypothetical protein K2X32_05230 [Phycisphaerales bacterium]|nr:hypothetical protein [Phycisphaerales bacterium]
MHSSTNRHHHPRGNSGINVVGVVIVGFLALLLVVVLLPTFGRRPHGASRQLKDATQVRGIHQAMVFWAESNKEMFPLPSQFDRMGATIGPSAAIGGNPEPATELAGDPQRAKDTTANIYSMLIWNNSVTPEILVSPAEASGSIEIMDGYSSSEPKTAVDPKHAKWDPAFSADFTTGKGNTSYAHMQPSGLLVSPDPKLKGGPNGRLTQWRDTYDATTAVIGSRGPEIKSVESASTTEATAVFANPMSTTLLVLGSKYGWGGNIVFNDNHVDMMSIGTGTPHRTNKHYLTAAGKQIADCIFFDESDDPTQSNTYLGIFTKAGEKPSDFKAIWD